MAELTIQKIDHLTGFSPDATGVLSSASASGDDWSNDDRSIFFARNTDAMAAHTVTIAKAFTSVRVSGFGDITLSDISLSVPASADMMIFAPPGQFNSGGKATATYGGDEGSFSVAALRLARA